MHLSPPPAVGGSLGGGGDAVKQPPPPPPFDSGGRCAAGRNCFRRQPRRMSGDVGPSVPGQGGNRTHRIVGSPSLEKKKSHFSSVPVHTG